MELFETKEGQRIKALERMLIEVVSELTTMIDRENERLHANISCTDLDPPDYLDHETAHRAMALLNDK